MATRSPSRGTRTPARDLVAAPPPLHRPPWPKLWISHLMVEAKEVGKGKKIDGKRGEARGLVPKAPLLAIAGGTPPLPATTLNPPPWAATLCLSISHKRVEVQRVRGNERRKGGARHGLVTGDAAPCDGRRCPSPSPVSRRPQARETPPPPHAAAKARGRGNGT
jgi:hypothetical protein